MKICLIRHGETDWNSIGKFQGREDIPLNKTGIEQMQKTVNYLKRTKWDEIITSPLSRAKMSAELIGKGTGLEKIHEEPDFIERDFGKISGMTREDVKANFLESDHDGIEPLEKLQDRTINALMRCINYFDGKNIIIITHGAAINSILTRLSGNKIEMGKAIPGNGDITLLEKQGDDTINIVFYNKGERELSGGSTC